MPARSGIVAAVLAAFVVACSSVRADTKAIQGTVIGTDGKPLAGANVRADRLDQKGQPPAVTKTDTQGHYVFKALPVGAYAIIAAIKGVPKSRAMVKTRADGWAKVDFDLRIKSNDPSIKKKYVWVNGEPGSHIGGHWVEVDQANMPSTSAVDTVNEDDVRRMQRGMQQNTNMTFPGH
jgi:hypothetical protein